MKKVVSILLLVFALAVFSQDIKGSLVIVGGGNIPQVFEECRLIFQRFIELACEGRGKKVENVRIGIMPTASSKPIQSARSFMEDFKKFGVREENMYIIPIALFNDDSTEKVDESLWRDNANNVSVAQEVEKLDAIWFVGGDQTRYVNTLLKDGKETPVLRAIWKIYSEGAVLGGSSAGAAIMTDPMISGGTSFDALLRGITYEDDGSPRLFITKGLGFFKGYIVDQHFSKRGRFARLLVAMADQKIQRGFGIDEDTALIVKGMDEIEVIGRGGVFMLDISNAKIERVAGTWSFEGVRVSYFEKGDKYTISTGKYASIPNRKLIKNNEYYESQWYSVTNFMEIKNIITYDVVDNMRPEVSVLAVEDITKPGTAFVLRFYKDKSTRGYWGKINEVETYGVLNVLMDLKPVKLTVAPLN
uniref:Cyanophycinase n=1 Tax=Fervidobacterium nodosum TaxID=2424 RepID=A0A7C5Y2K7_9BACT